MTIHLAICVLHSFLLFFIVRYSFPSKLHWIFRQISFRILFHFLDYKPNAFFFLLFIFFHYIRRFQNLTKSALLLALSVSFQSSNFLSIFFSFTLLTLKSYKTTLFHLDNRSPSSAAPPLPQINRSASLWISK